MFTGIVQAQGRIVDVRKTEKGTFTILVELNQRMNIGDSVAINGVCLTVTAQHESTTSFNVIEETLRRTNLHELVRGSTVNVELSLKLSDRIDGHLVMGHIDGVGKISSIEKETDESIKMWFEAQSDLVDLLISKGAIALDGISLTLVDVLANRFSVSLIPHTMKTTNLANKKVGDSVNVEVDFFAKYIKKFIGQLNIQDVHARTKA
jgi:riboflavin synthase